MTFISEIEKLAGRRVFLYVMLFCICFCPGLLFFFTFWLAHEQDMYP